MRGRNRFHTKWRPRNNPKRPVVIIAAMPRVASPRAHRFSHAKPIAVAYCVILTVGGASAQPAPPNDETLTFSVSQSLRHESNLLRLPSGLSPSAITAGAATSRSDLVSQTRAGVNFDGNYSLQRIRADASVALERFRENGIYDNNGYNAGAIWDAVYGRQWYGQALVRANRSLASFDDTRSGERNIVSEEFLRLQAGYRFTPAWSAIGAFDLRSRDYSAHLYDGLDTRVAGTEVGARWEPLSGADWRFLWRHAAGRYPNRQVFDALGNRLPGSVDNEYAEDRVFMRVGMEPSDKTRLQADIGYTSRRYENLSERDFGGITFGAEYTLRPNELFRVNGYARRDLGNSETLISSYVDSRVVGIGTDVWLTGKTSLRMQAEHRREEFGGDPGYLLFRMDQREDRLGILSGSLTYEVSRKILLSALLRFEKRNSNYSQFDFDARTIGVNAEIRY